MIKRSISPLIATILLIVVSVILVTVILTWGQDFVDNQLSKTTNFSQTFNTDLYQYIRLVDSKNGRFIFSYSPPNNVSDHNFTITSFTYNGGHVIPLPEEKTITSPGTFTLDLGIVDTEPFYINLIFDSNYYLPFNDLSTSSVSPRESDCPAGFIPVPGNHLYGTVQSKGGFCVAKYEMKMDFDSDDIGDNATEFDCNYNSTYNVWDYSKSGCSTGTIVSTKEGSPIARITQTQSINACNAVGGHLITNDEWMTLARNIEMVPSNWGGGEIGSGYIYSGHNDNGPASALEASIDIDGYFGTNQTTGNQRRTLKLTNGQTIWDLAGNVYEWTNDIIQLKDQPDAFNYSDDSENNDGLLSYWASYSKDSSYTWYLKYTDLGITTLKYKDLFLLTSGAYSSNNGIGAVYRTYSDRESISSNNRAFLRSGYWRGGASAGLLALLLNYGTGSQDSLIGFRCVVVP